VPAAGPDGLVLQLHLGHLPPGDVPATMVSGFARITPATVPDVLPAVVTDTTVTPTAAAPGAGTAIRYPASVVAGVGVSGEAEPVDVVARARALPLVGDEGMLADLGSSLVEFDPPTGAVVDTELLAADGTPPALLRQVRAAGVALVPLGSEAARVHELRHDAFSLGLRIFLLVGLATLLLAVFGVFASAVLQSRWRSYEVASLRVVGVSRRSLVRASVLEHAAVLGTAVGLGVVAALLSVELVLPAMNLGTAAPHDPAPVHGLHPAILAGTGVLLFGVALLIAWLVSVKVTRAGRPETLRWAEQG
jgi:putative ABC transport system permease protein